MYNAAIIVFKRSALPKILNFFAKPGIYQTIEAGTGERQVKIYIIECPVMKRASDNKAVGKLLRSLCIQNNISFFVGRNIEYYQGSGLEYLENSIERGSIDEIRAIKDIAALIKFSADNNVNLLKKNICFIGESHRYRYVSTMSEEAAGVFIYEHEKMNNDFKREIFERLMSEKGISASITKDLQRAISQCAIIIADNSVNLEEYQELLNERILIGDNAAESKLEKVSRVILWYDKISGLSEDTAAIQFNDELLGILRHFCKEKGPIDFIRKFPYIQISSN